MIKLHNADCLDIFNILQNNSIDLIVTDPPYKIQPHGTHILSGMFNLDEAGKGKLFKDTEINLYEYAKEFKRVLKDNCHCYVMCNDYNLQNFLNTFISAGFNFSRAVIWNKCNKIYTSVYHTQHEYILIFNTGMRLINKLGTPSILSIPNIKLKNNNVNLHNTEKPVDLMKILIENSSNIDEVVLDPFMGIGSTGVACKLLNRSFIGVEIDKNYYEIASKRINNAVKSSKLF